MCQFTSLSAPDQGNVSIYTHHQRQWPYTGYPIFQDSYQLKKYRGSRGGVRKVRKINTIIGNRLEIIEAKPVGTINRNNLTCVKLASIPKNSNFCLMNCQSVRNKAESVKDYILENNFQVCAMTETWLKSHDSKVRGDVRPNGYTLLHTDRVGKTGGGVAVICLKTLKPKKEKVKLFSSFEYMSVILTVKGVHFRLVVLYRPPDPSCTKFLEEFPDLLDEITSSSTHFVIAGDFNIHMNDNSLSSTTSVEELLETYNLKQHVNFATNTAMNTIDLIITRSDEQDLNVCAGSFQTDHTSILCTLNLDKAKPVFEEIKFRKATDIDVSQLKHKITDSEMYNNTDEDVEALVSVYNQTLTNLLDDFAPLITRNVRVHTARPWFNDTIKDEKIKRRKLERKWLKSKNKKDHVAFKRQREAVNTMINTAKSGYYCNLVKDSAGDQKKLYTLVNKITHKVRSTPLPDHESTKDLANDFNNFFAEKIEKIRQNFKTTNNFDQYDTEFDGNKLDSFRPLSEADVIKMVHNSSNKSCELDPIPTSLLKKCLPELAPTLTRIINTSLINGKMPKLFKHAVIKPLLKKAGSETIFKNYRPVSNLPYVSKLIERAVGDQLKTHESTHNLPEPCQSAYKHFHSTETALMSVVCDILSELDNKKVVLFTLLDLSAAFDTVDHELLLKRLKSMYGISDVALQWFESYLKGRTQAATANDILSELVILLFGVPQGSVLGPLLYSIYAKPLADIIRLFLALFHLFADDTQLGKAVDIFKDGELSEAILILQKCINAISDWMGSNQLKLNEEKTEFIFFILF